MDKLMMNSMDNKELKATWSQMLGKKKPSKEVISILQTKMLEDIVFEAPFIEEFHDSILIKYQGSIIAGLLPKTQYQVLTPWGNFEKFLYPGFWSSLAEKLVLSYENKVKTGTNKLKTSSDEIVKKFSKIHNEEKSNRSGGDLSELLTTKGLCLKYCFPFKNEKDLENVLQKINSMDTAKDKILKEQKNAELLLKGCIDIIEKTKESVVSIEWVGRCSNGTEDILINTTSQKLYISLKSISKTGTGTARNLGAASLLKIGCDIESLSNQMKESVINVASVQYSHLGLSSQSKVSDIKALSRENPSLKQMAEIASSPYLSSINELVFNTLKSLTQDQLKVFIKTQVLDQETYKELWVVVANEQGVSFWNQKDFSVEINDTLSVSDLTPKGFKVLKNNEGFIRVNTCCTNGKGLSAPCLRIFLD